MSTVPSRTLEITDRGRAALAFDRARVDLPACYSAWGADDSPVCENGHTRCPENLARNGGCRKCQTTITRKRSGVDLFGGGE